MATLANIENNTWGISTIGYGVIAEGISVIRQRIDIVLRTSKGSDPLRPEFGSNIYKFIDTPLNIAIPNIKAEIILALEIWVPEINVISIAHKVKDMSNPVFEITYQVKDDSLIDKLLFDIKQGQTTSTSVNEIILQAFFPPNPHSYRYQIKLIRNSAEANPRPDVAGFATIQEMFDWVAANWYFWGRWHLLSDRIVCYMDSAGVTNSTLSIAVLPIVRLAAVFPSLDPGQFFKIDFTIHGQPPDTLAPQTFNTPGEVFFWAQSNWAHYGTWYIEGIQSNGNTTLSDEFSSEFDSPLPDTFRLVLISTTEGFTGELQITTV